MDRFPVFVMAFIATAVGVTSLGVALGVATASDVAFVAFFAPMVLTLAIIVATIGPRS